MAEHTNDREFGEIALKKNYISRDQLEEALKIQKQKSEGRKNPPQLGDLLVDLGYLSREEVDNIARSQARQSTRNKIPGYKLLKKLGEGATGAVYKARNKDSGRAVAIKVLFPSIQKDKQFLKRFFREARTVSRLHHENIIRGIDVGEHDGLYYFVMEYVDGRTLLEILNQDGPFSEDQGIDIARQITRALTHAEEHGLVHRDIKPENIMIDRDDVVKLCDLGLAKKTQDEAKSVTRTGASVGTPYYMSPEQATGEDDIDVRTDLYSLGASLYRVLTDRVPFDGKTSAEIMTKHITEDLVPPRDINPNISESMDRIIQKMMEKDRADRYQTPGELLDDLNRISSGRSLEHAPVPPSEQNTRDTWVPEFAATLRTRAMRYFIRLRNNWSPIHTVRSLLIGTLSLTLIIAVLYFTSGDATPTSAGGSGSVGTIQAPGGSTSPPTDDGGSPPQNTTDDGPPSQSTNGRKKNDSGDQPPSSSSDEQTREWFRDLKKSVKAFDGNLEKVNDLSKEISTFQSKHSTERWWYEAKKLRDRFLNKEARKYFQKTVRPRLKEARKQRDLDRAHALLNTFPNLFNKTDTWNTIKKKKKQILKEIKSTCDETFKRARTFLKKENFQNAREVLADVKPMLSSKLTPERFDRHEKLKQAIRRRREERFAQRFERSKTIYFSFHDTFKKQIPLHQKSIFQIDLRPLSDLIEKHRKKIALESFRKRLDEYGKDVRLLKYYRELLSEGIQKAIRTEQTMNLDTPGASSGPITERNGDTLVIQIQKKATTSRTISSLSLERRLAFAGAKSRKHTTQQKLAFGLAAYYANHSPTATEWFQNARKDGDERASFYLDRMEHDPTHLKVTLMMEELEKTVNKKEKLKTDVLLDLASEHWKSDGYQKDIIRRAQSLVNPDSFFDDEKSE